MLKTKMISAMKQVKDRMDNFVPVAEMNQLLDILKTTGASHIEIASVIGHPNFASYSKQWADAIHAHGMLVTWRCSHQNMEGLYNAPHFVGGNRKPTQFWIDEAVNAAKALDGSVKAGDEWAIYPERTEGVFQDATSWIDPNGMPGTYAQFFIDMQTACKAVLPAGTVVGLSANNASELLSGWMPASLVNFAGMSVVDHYRDGDPTLYDTEIRQIGAKYGKLVYVMEGSPDRFNRPTRAQADAYYAVNKKLADDGVLVGFGSWSGWAGNPESTVDKDSAGKYVLNENGKSLQAWWSGVPTPPVPPVPPIPPVPSTEQFVDISGTVSQLMGLTNLGNVFERVNGTWTKVPLPKF